MHLSVVIPVYNSATAIKTVVDDCFTALSHLDFELVLVNDGSADTSEEELFELAKQHPNVKAISLAKNVGEFNAVMCGLNYTTGEYVAIIDDDGQNPPSEILKLLAVAEKGCDVVYAKYREKKHSWWRNAGSWVNNFFAFIFIGKPWGLYLSSFKVMSKKLVEEVVARQYRGTYLDGLIFRYRQNYSVVEVNHKESVQSSRYNVFKLVGAFLSMIDSGAYKFFYFIFLVVVSFGLLPILIAPMDSEVSSETLMIINSILYLFLASVSGAVSILLLTLYFNVKILWRGWVFKKAKKSFNA